jgi:hypothetical protein
MIKKRLAYCKKIRHWMEKQWRKVVYLDESTFRLLNSRGAKVSMPSSVSQQQAMLHNSDSKTFERAMVWDCFNSRRGRGGTYFFPKNTTMNGGRYNKALENHQLPFMQIHRASGSCRTLLSATSRKWSWGAEGDGKGVQGYVRSRNSPNLNLMKTAGGT